MNIEQIINDHLAKKNEERNSRVRSGKYNPSKMGRCYKAQLMDRQDIEPSNPIDERGLRVLACGTHFHNWIQGMLPDHDTEVKIENDDFCGYADIVTEDMVIDLKSQHSNAWHWMTKEGYNFNDQKRHDIFQVTFYAMMLGKPMASLCYISKDDLCVYQRTFEIKHFIIEVENEISMLHHFWQEQNVPAPAGRAYGIDKKTGHSNECAKYCPYRDMCTEKGF